MRINCIKVEDLTDQHLRAEWVEILMLPAYLRRSIQSKAGLKLYADSKYTLNTGHARFFYDKLAYVKKRYEEIEVEMNERGYKTNPTLDLSMYPEELFNDWTPSEEDQFNNLHRIITRILDKPDWYTYRGQRMTKKTADEQSFNWKQFYEDKYRSYKFISRVSDIKK